jgi:hypothetical protein
MPDHIAVSAFRLTKIVLLDNTNAVQVVYWPLEIKITTHTVYILCTRTVTHFISFSFLYYFVSFYFPR